MIEIYDIEDTSFLKDYEKYFLEENERTNNQYSDALKNMPQYLIEGKDYVKDLVSHYDGVFYPQWKRVFHRSYVFKFEPDKPTMTPHIDLDPETCAKIKGYAKRVIMYVNPYWESQWGGGTYFAPFEQYESSKHYTARVSRKKFAIESTLVENKPGRAVLFDPDEWHMPQEFSGSTVQRLLYSFLIVHPDFATIIDSEQNFITPDNDNGVPVASLPLSIPEHQLDPTVSGHSHFFKNKKNAVTDHVDTSVVDYIIKDIM